MTCIRLACGIVAVSASVGETSSDLEVCYHCSVSFFVDVVLGPN